MMRLEDEWFDLEEQKRDEVINATVGLVESEEKHRGHRCWTPLRSLRPQSFEISLGVRRFKPERVQLL